LANENTAPGGTYAVFLKVLLNNILIDIYSIYSFGGSIHLLTAI